MADRVRTYNRRTPGGGTQRVRQHSRGSRGRKGKPLLSPRHAWDLLKRSFRANKRKKHGLALTLGLLGGAELGGWAFLSGARLMFFTGGVLCFGAAAGAGWLTGKT